MADKNLNKPLCKLIKNDILEENLKEYLNVVKEPTHYCKKCGRVANSKKLLCKAEKISKDE
jgi:hypothetical protein